MSLINVWLDFQLLESRVLIKYPTLGIVFGTKKVLIKHS